MERVYRISAFIKTNLLKLRIFVGILIAFYRAPDVDKLPILIRSKNGRRVYLDWNREVHFCLSYVFIWKAEFTRVQVARRRACAMAGRTDSFFMQFVLIFTLSGHNFSVSEKIPLAKFLAKFSCSPSSKP